MHPPVTGISGDVEALPLYAGTDVGAITAIRPAAEIIMEVAVGMDEAGH